MGKVYYYRFDDSLSKEQIFELLAQKQHIYNFDLQEIIPNEEEVWLTEGLYSEFAEFIPLGTKEGKATKKESEGVIFKVYSRGAETTRDAWAYNFNQEALAVNMQKTIEIYNDYVSRWSRNLDKQVNIDDFVQYDNTKLNWCRDLKLDLKRGKFAEFKVEKLRNALYRPFTKSNLFFDKVMNHECGQLPKIFPTAETENQVICVSGVGHDIFIVLIGNCIVDLKFSSAANGGTQCFPFYTYAEDGSNRKENITDWALNHFQQHYQQDNITKWDIFYYVYGLLHHPSYREKYAANLKRELPRIPLVTDFCLLSQAGKQLANLHLHYEQQPEYPLQKVATPNTKPHYRVDKMRLISEKTSLIYNDSLTLKGIPAKAFEYRLGNRSALEWVIDQYQIKIDGHSGSRENLEMLNNYQVKTAKGSGIINNPNRLEDKQYILRLIGQVITVSLETVKIVENLPEL